MFLYFSDISIKKKFHFNLFHILYLFKSFLIITSPLCLAVNQNLVLNSLQLAHLFYSALPHSAKMQNMHNNKNRKGVKKEEATRGWEWVEMGGRGRLCLSKRNYGTQEARNEPIYMRHATRNRTPIPSIFTPPMSPSFPLPLYLAAIRWRRVE